jgi:hypothetical protein
MLRALAARHGIRPKKSLGQHFLIEPALARRIVELAEIEPGSKVLEIGAGLGSLTLALARAGADVLVPHMGLTTSGTIGARTALTLDEAVERVQAMRDAAVAVNPEILVLCHGGPIAEPDDAGYVLARTTGVCGFFGASSMERLPVERALTAQVRAFTELSFRLSRAGGSRHDREAHQARADRDVQLRVGHDEMVRVSGDNPGSGQLPGRGNHQPRPGPRQAPPRARR